MSDDLYLTIPRNQYKELDASLEIDPRLIAPIQKGQRVGSAVIKLKGEVLEKRPLVALQTVDEGSLMQIIKDEALLLFE